MVSASFLPFFKKHLTLYTLPHVISGKINFFRKAPSKCSLKLAINEEIFRLRIKNLQKGVGKYHFQRFIGRGIIIFKNPQNHVRFCLSQYRVCEGTNKSKRKNDKNAKKYHDSFASCQVI